MLLRLSSAIALELIDAHEKKNTVSLNEIRNRLAKKFKYSGMPRLVDIISAVPDEYKKALLPKLKARPIRTASGVSQQLGYELHLLMMMATRPDCGCGCDVQTAPMSPYRNDREHLRVRSISLACV